MVDAKPQEPEARKDHLEIVAACPQCGGMNAWSLTQIIARCSFCGSSLWWPKQPDEQDYLFCPSQVRSDADIIDILGTYDAMRVRADMLRRLSNSYSTYSTETFDIDIRESMVPGTYEIKMGRKHLFKLLESHRIDVPYLMVSSFLVYNTLGRDHMTDRKVYRPYGYILEDILPAYPKPWNFRDQGLWFESTRLHALTADKITDRHMEPTSKEIDLDTLIRRWSHRRDILVSELSPIAFHCVPIKTLKWWVYRPYYYILAETPDGYRWFLIDGQFSTIAGHPKVEEVQRIRAGDYPRLDVKSLRPSSIKIIPFRCPECGWDITMKIEVTRQFCSNCGELLTPTEDGLKLVEYETIGIDMQAEWPQGVQTGWLPFYRYKGTWQVDSESFSSILDLLAYFVPGIERIADQLPQPYDTYYLPAFDCLQYAGYETWAFATASGLEARPLKPRHARLVTNIHLEDAAYVVHPNIAREELEPIFYDLILETLPPIVQLRLNPIVLQRSRKARYIRKESSLVYIAFPILQKEGGAAYLRWSKHTIAWKPLTTSQWPDVIRRTVRRWHQKGKHFKMEGLKRDTVGPKTKKWMQAPLNLFPL